ncbi:MAG: helix-turn-helix transcriptional regulator [Clostridia bacterium]|nr:helix-turn-helix transcriptional regulator [Clostridia bacterium]
MDIETFGRRIAELRHRSGRTQQEVAAAVGVSTQAVSKWERGLSCPDILILDDVASVLGVEIAELFSNQL